MKWKNHRLTTMTAIYAISGSFLSTIIATMSSTLPDQLEAWGIVKHRTITHYPWLYIGLAMIAWVFFLRTPSYPLYFIFFTLVGCISHLIEDLMSTGGIPIFTPMSPPKGLHFYKTHEVSEACTAVSICICSAAIAWGKGLLEKGYLLAEADRLALLITGAVKNIFGKG